MLCQHCGEREATTHITSIVNGVMTEQDLCTACAKEQEYTNFFQNMSFDLGDLFDGILGAPKRVPQTVRCPSCGASFEEIVRSGRIGCAECYTVFHDRLLPQIRRIYGTSKHKGKVPGTSALRIASPAQPLKVVSPLEEKRAAMQKAIETQDFERAAVLRDEIRALEEAEKNG